MYDIIYHNIQQQLRLMAKQHIQAMEALTLILIGAGLGHNLSLQQLWYFWNLNLYMQIDTCYVKQTTAYLTAPFCA